MDIEAAHAVTQLVFIATNDNRHNTARWLAEAEATVARLGTSTDSATRRAVVELNTERSRAAYSAGDFELALDLARRGATACALPHEQTSCGELLTIEARVLLKLTRYPEAHEAIAQAVTIFQRVGREHSDTYARALRLEAVIVDAQGHHGEAIELFKRARSAFEALKTPAPSGLTAVQAGLARAYRAQGQYAEAIEISLSLLDDRVSPLVPSLRGVVLASLVWAYIKSGQSERALPYAERALLLQQSRVGSESQDWALAAAAKGKALQDLARIDDSVKTYDAAIAVLE